MAGSAAYSQTGSYSFSYNLASAGIYVAMTGIALVLIYAGNFLIHMGRKGYEGKMFGGHRKKHLYILIGAAVGFFVLGCFLVIASAAARAFGTMIYY